MLSFRCAPTCGAMPGHWVSQTCNMGRHAIAFQIMQPVNKY